MSQEAEATLLAMTTTVTNWVADNGLIAIFVLMALDSVLPAGGEIVMLFGGALAAGRSPATMDHRCSR